MADNESSELSFFKDLSAQQKVEFAEWTLGLVSDVQLKLIERILEAVDGNRVDREATRKHMESKGAREDQIWNMGIEADDLDDTIDGIVTSIEQIKNSIGKG